MHTRYRLVLFSIVILAATQFAFADTCNVDCNSKCCHTVRITPWDKNTICEPQCKLSCEASKRVCRASGGTVSPPIAPSVVSELEKRCAVGFDVVVKSVVASYTGQTAFDAKGVASKFDDARKILIATGLFESKEFNGVTIRFCRLTGTGLAYDRNRICITDHYSDGTHLRDTASVLAHEMFHIRQYRNRGTDNFKCEYSKQFLRNGGKQDRGMDMERDAYEFQDRATNVIDMYLGQGAGVFGAYTVASDQGSKCSRQWAYVTSSDGNLVLIDQCGRRSTATFASGRLTAEAWKLSGSFDDKVRAISWDNGSVWSRQVSTK